MNEPVSVSCVIFLFNEEKYIKQCLRSVLDQTSYVHEIIVSDDYSTDATAQIVKKLSIEYPHIKYVLSSRKGKFHAYRTGLKHVTGSHFFIMAGDDAIESDYVEKSMLYLNEKGIDFFYSNAFLCDHHLNKIKPVWAEEREFLLCDLLIRNWAGGFLFSKSNNIQSLLEIDDDKILFEDWVCAIKLVSIKGALMVSEYPGYLYRRHALATTKKLSPLDLRRRDIMLYEYLLDMKFSFSQKEVIIIETRIKLHTFLINEYRSWKVLFGLLLSNNVFLKEKIKLLLMWTFGISDESKINALLSKKV